jgi:hypothetical protein
LLQEFPMSKFLRVAALLSCLGVLVLGTIALDPNGPLLSSFRGCTGGRTSWAEALEEKERIARIKEASLRRRNTKKQIAEEVIAGRRSLAESMAQFHALDLEWPQFGLASDKARAEGISEDEWDGRKVIIMIRQVLFDRPDEEAAVIARLEKELQELLAERKKRPAAPVEKPIERSR